jgi:hypothetical protein
MTINERINEMKNTLKLEMDTVREDYLTAESKLVSLICDYVTDAEVSCTAYGIGKIVKAEGTLLNNIIVNIVFENTTQRFSLPHIITNAKFVKFVDLDIDSIWNDASELHAEMTASYRELTRTAEQLALEAEKKAQAEKKAEEKYQRLKDKAVKDFDELVTNANKTLSDVDEFYYALGWLTKHVGTISAVLPDYLESSFVKHFGTETCVRVVDSKKKTVNGYSMQWTFGFKATLRKAESLPSIWRQYISSTGKAIANTSFIWDLIDNYGFCFGKKQDVEKIKQSVPSEYIDSFEAGLMA